MKQNLIFTICSSLLLSSAFSYPVTAEETTQTLESVTLNEVAHSIFYAPQYAAIELGYFEDEGIDLELVTGFGAI